MGNREINAWNLASSSGKEILKLWGVSESLGQFIKSQKLYLTPRGPNSAVCPRAQENVFLTSPQMPVLVHRAPVKTHCHQGRSMMSIDVTGGSGEQGLGGVPREVNPRQNIFLYSNVYYYIICKIDVILIMQLA